MLQCNKPQKHYPECKKLITITHIFYDTIYMDDPEQANPLRQKVD